MNTVNINDQEFMNTESYKNFITNNPDQGYLKIRAYAASQAIPISGLKITISHIIDNTNVIFFEGYTNDSGMIDKITLPTPKPNPNNLIIPNTITYNISSTYLPDNSTQVYKVDMYSGVCVIQNILIIPEIGLRRNNFYGS